MNDVIKTVLSLSVSGSIIAIILFAVRALLKDKISKTWQYYIWLVVILRLLIPYTSEMSILNGLFNSTEINAIIPIDNVSPNYQIANEKPLNEIVNENLLNEKKITQNTIENDIVNDTMISTKIFDSYLSDIQEYGWLVWLFISAIVLLKKIISYHVYVHYIKSNRKLITDESIVTTYDEVCGQAGITRKITLYSYKKINSPMLIGFVKPYILLPEAMLKTTDGLQYILLHELTHYRRLDFIYKWFVQIAVCVHFFNPVVYFVRKSINKACEFSCDEMVIKKLDEQSKKEYGTALIDALAVSVGYNQHAISFMLCEDIKIIKERLGAIMKYKKGNKFILVITMFLTATISFGAVFTGAYAASNGTTIAPVLNGQNNNSNAKIDQADNKIENNYTSEDWHEFKKHVKKLPDKEQFGTLTQYKHFGIGNYELSKAERYTLDISWHQGGTIKMYCIGESGYQEEYTITSGIPTEINVPKDDFYSFRAPLSGETITKFQFNFYKTEAAKTNPQTLVSSKEQARLEYEKQNVLVRSTDLLTYDNTEHYYIKEIVDNNSKDSVISYKLSLLAFDKSGNPKKVAWWSEPLYDSNGWVKPVAVNGKYTDYNDIREYELVLPYNMDIISLDFGKTIIDDSYRRKGIIYDEHGNVLDYKHFDFSDTFLKENILKPGQSTDKPGTYGWSLFDGWGEGGHGLSYVIGCITEIQYEGKENWINPYYEYWLEDYKGKTVSVEKLKNYYKK